MSALPDITVEHSGQAESKKKKERQSNYHILINTNKRPSTDADAERMVNALEKAVDTVFKDPRSLERMIRFNIPRQHFDERYIQDISVTHGPEVGSLQGRVHTHVILKIKHTSNITVAHSREEILHDILETKLLDPWNVTNLLIRIELLRDNVRAAEIYSAKDQTASKRKLPKISQQDNNGEGAQGGESEKSSGGGGGKRAKTGDS